MIKLGKKHEGKHWAQLFDHSNFGRGYEWLNITTDGRDEQDVVNRMKKEIVKATKKSADKIAKLQAQIAEVQAYSARINSVSLEIRTQEEMDKT